MSKRKKRFEAKTSARDAAVKDQPELVEQTGKSDGAAAKKEVSGVWALLLFAGFLLLIFLLEWLGR
jgi:hypothetical protein